jgi:tyrosine-protein phosphatase SIW14
MLMQPLLNHIQHRTGCTVAVIRHVYGVAVHEIEAEYRQFAGIKVRDCDIKYINEYQVSNLHQFFIVKEEKIQERRLRRRSNKMARYIIIAAISLSIWLISLYFSPAYHTVVWSQA